MCQVIIRGVGVGLGSVTLSKVLLVDSGLSDVGSQKGEHVKAFRDGPSGVKWFLGWGVINKNSLCLVSAGNPSFCFQCALSCQIEIEPQISD